MPEISKESPKTMHMSPVCCIRLVNVNTFCMACYHLENTAMHYVAAIFCIRNDSFWMKTSEFVPEIHIDSWCSLESPH